MKMKMKRKRNIQILVVNNMQINIKTVLSLLEADHHSCKPKEVVVVEVTHYGHALRGVTYVAVIGNLCITRVVAC